MATTRREVGFWSAVGHLRLRDLWSVESVVSIAIGSSLAYAMYGWGTADERVAVAEQFVGVAAALIGIVFAGIALVTALLSDDYLRLLESADDGLFAFLRPFMLAVGIQVATVLGAISYCALANHLWPALEPWLFGVLSIFFVSSCMEIVVLMRSIFMHARLRARFATTIKNASRD